MSTTTLTYLGGPTAILEYAGLRILLDPTFDPPGSYDSDGDLLTKTEGPALAPDEVGAIDLVLLSHHEHEDNLDLAGREFLSRAPLTLSTAKAGADLGRPVIGLDNWESHEVGTVTVTAAPALHGPPGCEPLLGPVIGFVLEADGEPTVYVSGDNASLALVGQIADRFPGIDIAVLFAGAARIDAIDAPLTLTSADAAEAARILGVRRVAGLHTEDWAHFSETRAQLEAAFEGSGLLAATPRGERVTLS
ncbi:MBL fold metallo-hydrolase [Galbitalea soli]|uniref:MBL fold metallo-hydrolase n=1 Tax=Galbitalea soli TaxID=1268042 RepID=A0A7C9TQQ2_9MICO|nr:MBL fold metallo-hydrolase [Galbitalea soli]NEM90784.1 MBL fold metallo-hydrolase [Galbitalea soli]NYJ31502.1 L-ascorbate metabolism protein UlaG (beta-lactamase superfamily) [Galbitalea soli]